jgi:hypothetical protein
MHRSCSALLLASVTAICGCWRTTAPSMDAATPLVDATTLAGTDFVPVLGQSIQPDRNYVYCATFQLAWDQLKQQLGGPLRYEKSLPLADLLNQESFDLKDISPDSYFVFCQKWEPGVGKKIQALRDERFPQSSLAVPEIPGEQGGYVAYSYLLKLLEFSHVFERHHEALIFHHSNQVSRVASFGSRANDSLSEHEAAELSGEVRVLSYASPDDFVITLYPKGNIDQIVLAKLSPGRTLDETLGQIEERIANHGVSFEEGSWNPNKEPLWIPLIQLHVHGQYTELEGKTFKTSNSAGPIVWTSQDLRFRLDETGARVESQASATTKSPTTAPPIALPKPRRFLFDRPFLVLLRRFKAKKPYLAAWIANAYLLESFE